MAVPLVIPAAAALAAAAAGLRAAMLGDADLPRNIEAGDNNMANVAVGGSLIVPGSKFEWGGSVKGSCVGFKIVNHERKNHTVNVEEMTALDGLVAQTIRGTIQKNPRQLYEVGSDRYFLVEGRPTGQGQISHILGPNTQNIWSQLADFANVCQCTDLMIERKKADSNGDCVCLPDGTGITGSVLFSGGLLQGLTVTATAQDFVLSSDLTFMFFDLQSMDAIQDKQGGEVAA